MMILENDLEIAPCLSEGLISDSAQDAIVAARGLGNTRWASVARAWSVVYLFSRMESIFASDQDPVAALRGALEDLTEFLTAAANCGLAALGAHVDEDLELSDDRRSIEGVTGEHYGKLFERFSEASYWGEPLRLLSLRLTRNGIDTSSLKGKEVLDAGCGAGRYTVAWHMLGASRTVGIDVSSIGIHDARRRIAEAEIGGVEFQEGNVLQLPVEDNSFDIVFSNGVLHHTADWQAGVRELTRVLRSGGLGWLYLIEKPGGLFWDLIEVMRAIVKDEKRDVIRAALHASGTPANRIFYMLDHVLVPINLRLTPDEIESCLAKAGATGIRRLCRGTDFDRIERIYQKEPYADVKYGVGENRYVFSKD
jgi:ubiquinone/menaquinone biosynthesis C-methylase UbiE